MRIVPLFALIALLAGTAGAELHIVNQVNLTFSPDVLDIVQGDTVRWVWSSGPHTVTNGNGLDDPQVGSLFDAPLDGSNTQFEFTFDTSGSVPYFCRPHLSFSMVGVINVAEKVALDDSSFGRVKALYTGDQPIR